MRTLLVSMRIVLRVIQGKFEVGKMMRWVERNETALGACCPHNSFS